MKRYGNLEKAMCRELERLDKKYGGDVNEMSAQDLDRADALFHAMKSAETYYAMVGAEEDDETGSARHSGRYRDPHTGRYVYREDSRTGRYPGWNPMEYMDPYWDRR